MILYIYIGDVYKFCCKYWHNVYLNMKSFNLMEYITMCLDSTNKVEQRYVRHN